MSMVPDCIPAEMWLGKSGKNFCIYDEYIRLSDSYGQKGESGAAPQDFVGDREEVSNPTLVNFGSKDKPEGIKPLPLETS